MDQKRVVKKICGKMAEGKCVAMIAPNAVSRLPSIAQVTDEIFKHEESAFEWGSFFVIKLSQMTSGTIMTSTMIKAYEALNTSDVYNVFFA